MVVLSSDQAHSLIRSIVDRGNFSTGGHFVDSYNVDLMCISRKDLQCIGVIGMLLFSAGGCSMKLSHPTSPTSSLRRNLASSEQRERLIREHVTSDDADKRREGVHLLGSSPYKKYVSSADLLAQLAKDDPDVIVRLTAVKMLARFPQYRELLATYEETARDSDARVRLETVQQFATLRHNHQSVSILLRLLRDDTDVAVRAGAAAELGYHADAQCLEALLVGLTAEEFHVSYRSRESLQRLTGQDFAYDVEAWRSWIAQQDNIFLRRKRRS